LQPARQDSSTKVKPDLRTEFETEVVLMEVAESRRTSAVRAAVRDPDGSNRGVEAF